MPMPQQSLLNIMPSPMIPLNIPLPRVEANRRPYGTYQKNNQPFRTQQEDGRELGTIRDSQARGITNQNLPITNPPERVPPSRLLRKETSPNPIELPNELDLQGINAEAVSNQGQNLRQNRGVVVAATEFMTVRSNLRPTRTSRRVREELGIRGTRDIRSFGEVRARVVSGPLIRSKDEGLNTGSGAGSGAGAMTPSPPMTPPITPPQRVASDTDTQIGDTGASVEPTQAEIEFQRRLALRRNFQ
jgi:hypothetical protein